MKVAYAIQDFPPEVGAGPARVSELAQRWLSLGCEISVLTGFPSRRLPTGTLKHDAPRTKLFSTEEWHGIRVIRSKALSSDSHSSFSTILNNASYMAASAISGVLKLGKQDVLIASSPPFLAQVGAAFVARVLRIPLVVEIRDYWPDYLAEMGKLRATSMAGKVLFGLERRMMHKAAAVVVISDRSRERAIAKGARPGCVHVIPNGVDTSLYKATHASHPLLEPLRCAGKFVVGYGGTFGLGQNLELFIDVAQRCAAVLPHAQFVFAGAGRSFAAMLEASQRLPNVIVRAPLRRDEMPAFYSGCHVSLVPHAALNVLEDTIPSKLFEVMACERPVLASAGGETRRIVNESGAGICVSAEDSAAITNALIELAGRPQHELDDMGRKGRSYVTARYERSDLANQYLTILRQIRNHGVL